MGEEGTGSHDVERVAHQVAGQVLDVCAALLGANIGVAQLLEPPIPPRADGPLGYVVSEAGCADTSLQSDVDKNRRSPSAPPFDGSDRSKQVGSVSTPAPVSPTEGCQLLHHPICRSEFIGELGNQLSTKSIFCTELPFGR